MTNLPNISVTLSEEAYAKIKRLSEKKQRSMSSIGRDYIEEKLEMVAI